MYEIKLRVEKGYAEVDHDRIAADHEWGDKA